MLMNAIHLQWIKKVCRLKKNDFILRNIKNYFDTDILSLIIYNVAINNICLTNYTLRFYYKK